MSFIDFLSSNIFYLIPFNLTAILFTIFAIITILSVIGVNIDFIDVDFPFLELDISPDAFGYSTNQEGKKAKIPLIIYLTLFMTIISVIAWIMAFIIDSIIGNKDNNINFLIAMFSLWADFIIAFIITEKLKKRIYFYLSEKSSAVSKKSLIGEKGYIVLGEARKDFPAEGKVKLLNKETLYVFVEPKDEKVVIKENEHFEITGQKDEHTFYVKKIENIT